MFADQSPEQWARDHLVFVLRVAGPHRYGAEGEVLGIASVPLRVVLEAPRFQLHTTLNVVGATSGSPPAGKLEIRLQLSTDPAPRAPGEVAYGGEALKLGVRLRDLRLHSDAEERALRGAARVAGGELPLLSVVVKTFHKGKLEGITPPQNLVRPALDYFWQVEVEVDNSLLEFVRTGCIVLEVWSGLASRSMQGGGSELLGIVQLPLCALQERLLRMVGPSSGTAAEFGGNPRKERYPDIAMDTNRPVVNPIDARECGMIKAMVCLGTAQQMQRLELEEQGQAAPQSQQLPQQVSLPVAPLRPASTTSTAPTGPLRFSSGPSAAPPLVAPNMSDKYTTSTDVGTRTGAHFDHRFPLPAPGPVGGRVNAPAVGPVIGSAVGTAKETGYGKSKAGSADTERQLHTFSIQVTGASGIPAVPANKRTADGKPSAIGSAARGRYVRYMFCGETEAVVTRAETTTSHDPVFQSGGQHHLMLRSLQELHHRLSQHEGVRFQVMGRQQNGADVVLAEALLPSAALLELAIDADASLSVGASDELPARDFTLEAVVDTAAAKAAGAIVPSNAAKPQPVLKLCVEYKCAPLRLRDSVAVGRLPARQFPGQAPLSVVVLRATGLTKAADAAGLQADAMEEGLNVYITCYIYDGKNVTDVVQTGIVRQSFAPIFNFKELLSLDISREFLLGSARAASEVVFEARHRPADAPPPTGDGAEDESRDIVLGTAAVPLLPVLQSETGMDGTFELRTDQQQPVGKIQVHLSVPGVHAPFDPTAAAVGDVMESDGLEQQTGREARIHSSSPEALASPDVDSGGAATDGNTKYLLRSRITINIPDARLPPSVLQPLVAQDLLFYLRYKWYKESEWSHTSICPMLPDRSLVPGYSRSIMVDADADFARYLQEGAIELELLPVGGDGASCPALLRLDEALRREVTTNFERIRYTLYDEPSASESQEDPGRRVFSYPQVLQLLRRNGVTTDDQPLLELAKMADGDADGLVSAAELLGLAQAIVHVPHVQDADLVVASAIIPLSDLALNGAEDAEKELRVAGGVLELSSPAAPLEPGGAVRAQAVLEFFKRSARTRVTPTPPRVARDGLVEQSQPHQQSAALSDTPRVVGPGHRQRVNLRGVVGDEIALDQSMVGGPRMWPQSPADDNPDG